MHKKIRVSTTSSYVKIPPHGDVSVVEVDVDSFNSKITISFKTTLCGKLQTYKSWPIKAVGLFYCSSGEVNE
jgi:hypothetical protein